MTDELIVDESGGVKKHGVLLLVFWLPFVSIFLVDLVGRFGAEAAMPKLGSVERPRGAPSTTVARVTGDLVRMAGVPFIRSRLPHGSRVTVANNSFGFRDNEEILSKDPEVIICGASFADHGTSNDASLTALIRQDCDVTIQNRSMAGQGPTASVTGYFLGEKVASSKSRVVVWCMIERDLGQRWMKGFVGLDAKNTTEVNQESLRQRQSKKAIRSYPSRFDGYYKTTSVSREFFSNYGHLLPPTCFDRGLSSHCRLYQLDGDPDHPIAFYRPSLNGHKKKFEERAAQKLADNMLKLDAFANSLGKKLLVVLVPDKYTVYGDRVEALVVDDALTNLVQNSERLDLVEHALRVGGAEVLNLRPVLTQKAAVSPKDELLYYREDTHWNDRGIRVGAGAIAIEVNRLLKTK
ncbi:MAG: hypothetical protein ACI97A_003950 [Planctomycetota bacterium]|jgi:hypothetical protein